MKKLISILFATVLCMSVMAQGTNELGNHFLKVYRQALRYNDPSTAISSLHNYIVTDANSMVYKDTLSMLYFTTKSYFNALLLAEEVYKAVPENFTAMARAAECYQELGDPKTACNLYEKAIPNTKNPYDIYKLALCQYQLKRLAESEASAKLVLSDTSSKKIGVNFTLKDGNTQFVPANAAAANLLGVLKMDEKNFTEAKADFELALKFFPDFAGAKDNLEICDIRKNEKAKIPTKKK